jgi:hypothetical protein
MRLLKLALLSFLVFFGLITAMSLLIPAHVRISKAINIAGRSNRILSLVNDSSQWGLWHPAFQMPHIDSLLQHHQITITPLVKTDSLVRVNWLQAGKPPVQNSWQVHRFAASDSITLQWYMDFRLQWYPWEKFSSLFFEKTYGLMMERGLQNLKKQVEGTVEH